MKKFAACLLAASAFSFPAQAQLTLMGAGVNRPVSGGGGGGYTGIVDVVGSPRDCWGFRACSASVASSNGALFDLRDAGDTTTTTVHATSTGVPNSSEISSAGCTTIGAGCKVAKAYGQINGNHCTQAAFADMPTFDPDGEATGKPALYSPAGQGLTCSGVPTSNAPWTIALTIKPITTPGGNNRIMVGPDPTGILYNSSGFAVYAGGLSTSTTAAVGSYYAVVGQSGSSSTTGSLRVNGTDTNGTLDVGGTNSLNSGLVVLGTGQPQDGRLAEWAVWPIGLNATQRGDVVSNMRTYGGF